jgi:hypothetical protein
MATTAPVGAVRVRIFAFTKRFAAPSPEEAESDQSRAKKGQRCRLRRKNHCVGMLMVSEQLITDSVAACVHDSERSAAIPRVNVPLVSAVRVPRNCSAKEPEALIPEAARVLVRAWVNVKVNVPPPAEVGTVIVSLTCTTTPVPAGTGTGISVKLTVERAVIPTSREQLAIAPITPQRGTVRCASAARADECGRLAAFRLYQIPDDLGKMEL